MPEYLLAFEENSNYIAQTRFTQKRRFSLVIGTVIIPTTKIVILNEAQRSEESL
jgi:hypothetical protein